MALSFVVVIGVEIEGAELLKNLPVVFDCLPASRVPQRRAAVFCCFVGSPQFSVPFGNDCIGEPGGLRSQPQKFRGEVVRFSPDQDGCVAGENLLFVHFYAIADMDIL